MAPEQPGDPRGSTCSLMVCCNYSEAAREDSMNAHKDNLLFTENYLRAIHGDLISDYFFPVV